jgi:predicted nucleotidyltransferase
VKDWNEIEETYGSTVYKNVGYAKIKAKIVDDANSIFTPCTYIIDKVDILDGSCVEPIKEIVSFRGRFCEQARKDEKVMAQGKVEKVQKIGQEAYYRLLLGSKPTDYMILA